MKYVLEHLYLEMHQGENALKTQIAKRLGISERNFRYEIMEREFVLESNHHGVAYRVVVDTAEFIRDTSIHFLPTVSSFEIPQAKLKRQPLVVGAGIAGLFCAYVLALAGACPVVIDRGKNLDERLADQALFNSRGRFDPQSHYRFGLGGMLALTGFRITRDDSLLSKRWVLEIIEKFGIVLPRNHEIFLSPAQVQTLVRGLVREIVGHGGQFRFQTELIGARSFFGKIKEARVKVNGSEDVIPVSTIILCGGDNNPVALHRLGLASSTPAMNSVSFFLELPMGEIQRAIYGSPLVAAKMPPVFKREKGKTKAGMQTYVSFYYPNTAPVFVAKNPGEMNLALSLANPGVQQGAVVVTLCPKGKYLSKDEAIALTRIGFRRAMPLLCPGESVKDYLAEKEPLRLGSIRPAYAKGVYLANFRSLFGGSVGEALSETLAKLVKSDPALADGRALLLGPAIGFDNGWGRLTDEKGRTALKGVFMAAPAGNYDYDGPTTAVAGIQAAFSVLEAK